MKNVKKISSMLAALFSVGTGGGLQTAQAAEQIAETAKQIDSSNDENISEVQISNSEKNKSKIRILKQLPPKKSVGNMFLFNFRGFTQKPSLILEIGDAYEIENEPDFTGLEKCGISYYQSSEFNKKFMEYVFLKNVKWKNEYSTDIESYQESKKLMFEMVISLIGVAKSDAVKIVDSLAMSRDNKGKICNGQNLENRKMADNPVVKALNLYSINLGYAIDRCVESLHNLYPDLSLEDKNEITEVIKSYNENKPMNLRYFNKRSDIVPLRNVVVKLGEAKNIYAYTKLLLATIRKIDQNPRLLNRLKNNNPNGESNTNEDILPDSKDKKLPEEYELDAELTRILVSPDNFFDVETGLKIKQSETPIYNTTFNNFESTIQ